MREEDHLSSVRNWQQGKTMAQEKKVLERQRQRISCIAWLSLLRAVGDRVSNNKKVKAKKDEN